MENRYNRMMTLTKSIPEYQLAIVKRLLGRVNDSPFRGFKQGTMLLVSMDHAIRDEQIGIIRATFAINPSGFNTGRRLYPVRFTLLRRLWRGMTFRGFDRIAAVWIKVPRVCVEGDFYAFNDWTVEDKQ